MSWLRTKNAGRVAGLLLTAAPGLLAQEGNWSYHVATDMLSDLRNDEVWTNAATPAGPGYQFGVSCEDTEYVTVSSGPTP